MKKVSFIHAYINLHIMLSDEGVKEPISKSVSTELAVKEYNKINDLVCGGLFLYSADFVREAIREKLKTYDDVPALREVFYI